MPKPSFYTLLFAVAIAQVLVASAPTANALQGHVPVPPSEFARRAPNHADVNKRMLKKRRPQDNSGDIVPINLGSDPNQSTTTAATAQGGASQAPTTTRATTTAAQTTSSQGGLLADLSQLINGGTSTTKSSSTTSSTSTTSSAAAQTTTSSTPPATSSNTSATASRNTVSTSIVYVPGAATSTPAAQDPNASFLPHSAVIGLIVAGSCIAAAAAIWTIIRKWKFSPSRHFEDRLEPINWQPTQSSGLEHDPTVAALARSGSRTGTNRPGSYHSDNDNMTSVHHEPISMAPDFPPAHDFTAGPAGGAGYVDMHRGPSPAPPAPPAAYGGVGAGAAYGGHYEAPNPYDAYDYNNSGYGQRRY